MHREADLIVVGGGASGFFCAVNAARQLPGKKVLILEKTGKLLQKVRISGGGRCNVTHFGKDIEEMAQGYPRGGRFVRKAFHHFFVQDTISWFENRGTQLKAESDGRMFPVSNNSSSITSVLQSEANRFGVEIITGSNIVKLERISSGYRLHDHTGKSYTSAFVCLGTGGAPRESHQHWIAKATGHRVISPVPSLFTFNLPGHPISKLQGISTPVHIKLPGTKFATSGPLLVTHWGLSGPAVLKMSSLAAQYLFEKDYRFEALINWLPVFSENEIQEHFRMSRREHGRAAVVNANWHGLPSRLWAFLVENSGIEATTAWATLKADRQNKLAENLMRYAISASGKTTFKEEFVTAGGIDTAEVVPQTMESRKCPGLFLTGEMLNVDGITGGYNFQFAWTSGYLAAKEIAHRLKQHRQNPF